MEINNTLDRKMQTGISSYKELIVWQKSIQLVVKIYNITKDFPDNEKFNLISQINRAAVSIPANIAEGYGRNSSKNYIQFLRIARGSLQELETLFVIAKRLDYIDLENFEIVSEEITEIHKILNGLIKKIGLSVQSV